MTKAQLRRRHFNAEALKWHLISSRSPNFRHATSCRQPEKTLQQKRNDNAQKPKKQVYDLNSVGYVAKIVICLLFESLTSHSLEGLLYIDGFLCAGLEVRNSPLLLAPRKCALLRHNALVFSEINFSITLDTAHAGSS